MAAQTPIQAVVPPAPPPDRIGVSMTCINIKTGKVETFKGTWDGTQKPWLYTFVQVYSRMVPDEKKAGSYIPVQDKAEVVVVNILTHSIQSIEVDVALERVTPGN